MNNKSLTGSLSETFGLTSKEMGNRDTEKYGGKQCDGDVPD